MRGILYCCVLFAFAFNTSAQSSLPAQKKRLSDTLLAKYLEFYIPKFKTRIKQLKLKPRTKKTALMKLDLFDARQSSNTGEFHKSLPLLLAILDDYSPMAPADSALVLNEIIGNYFALKDIKNTLIHYNTLIHLSSRNPTIENKWNQVHLSSIYYSLGFYEEALHLQLSEKNKFEGSTLSKSSYANNRGLYWFKAGNFDSAHFYFKNALQIIEPLKTTNEAFYALIKGNVAQVYIEEHKYTEAIPLLREDIQQSKRSHNPQNAAINYIELAICFNNIKNHVLAMNYLDSFEHVKLRYVDEALELRYLKTKSDIYLNLGKKDSTIKYLNAYLEKNKLYERKKNYSDLYGIKVSQDVFQLQSDIKDKKKQLQIENRKIADERRQKQIYLFTLIIFIILSLVILYLAIKLNRRRKLVETKNIEITNQNITINKSLKDKEILIKEIHHRVKNNLQIISSLLKLQLNTTENVQAKISLADAHGRILSMALLHQQLMIKNEQSVVEVSDFIRTLGNHVEDSIVNPEKKISIIYKLETMFLHIDVASPICLIVNEVLVNSLKHASTHVEECSISINMYRKQNLIYLLVHDNGPGFDYETEKSKGTSLGLEIIETVSDQINSKFTFSNNNGSCFELKVPV